MTKATTMNQLLAALAFITSVVALAPPHPDFQEEFIEHRRRFLKSSVNATSMDPGFLLSPHLCSDLSITECQHMNNLLSRSTTVNLNLLKLKQPIRSLVLLVRFTDHADRKLPSREDVDRLWNSDQLSEQFPTGSIKRYFYRNSYGLMNLEASVMDWLLSDNTELHYSSDKSGLTDEIANSVYPILEQLDREKYDFSRHDMNGDMIIDSLVFLHSGFAAEVGSQDCYNNREFKQRIWSHANAHYSSWRSNDGYTFDSYMVASALKNVCGNEVAPIGVMTHEFIHTWGIPDLYDPDWVGKGTGSYEIMSNPFGWDGSQNYPFHMSPWTRMKSGFLEPIEIEYNGYYEIQASALSNQVYIIRANFPVGEYLLIENRQPLEYDAQIKGSGLLIWHIDDTKDAQKERGYPGQVDWPWNGKHYQVALLQADGSYDLEKGDNVGDANDFFGQGKELNPTTEVHPNSNAYQNGEIRSTGIRIYGISTSSEFMNFRVAGLAARQEPPTPSPSSPPSSFPSSTATIRPTVLDSVWPTIFPSPSPSTIPSLADSASPTEKLSTSPSVIVFTSSSSEKPSPSPSISPTRIGSALQDVFGSTNVTNLHPTAPSPYPTLVLSKSPSSDTTGVLTKKPSIEASTSPDFPVSATPTVVISGESGLVPTKATIPITSSTVQDASERSNVPSNDPAVEPSLQHSNSPSALQPSTIQPSLRASLNPSASQRPTSSPTNRMMPSFEPIPMPSHLETQQRTSFPTASRSPPSPQTDPNPYDTSSPTDYPTTVIVLSTFDTASGGNIFERARRPVRVREPR